ncbi:MAG: VWA domain-containing protein [Myxococcales bacterium]|nr:VWA domain-containing protein [Myxococcales bacterium]MCB9577559.1 VWA domain-containing protein [Polyangiaceae bacterium]
MRSVPVIGATLILSLFGAAAACSASGTEKKIYVQGGGGGGNVGNTGGAAGTTGTGGIQNDGGGIVDSGSNDSALSPDSACAAETAEAKPVPVNMYLMLDRSGSMSGKWGAATSAISTFVSDPAAAGLRVALAYFPTDQDDCDPLSYSTPQVPLGELTKDPAPADAQEQKLSASLSATGVTGLTPMFPAWVGTLGYCTSVAKKHPKEKVIAVLLTDGSPTGCDSKTNTIDQIAALAASAYADTPPIVTFAIGLEGSQEAEIKQVAQAGGGQAFFIGSSNLQADLQQKLNEIAGGELSCEYLLPETGKNGDPTDPGKVNVVYYGGGGSNQELVKVKDAASCTLNGWYYDDNQNPTRIYLCPATCSSVQNDSGAKVQVLLGCETKVPR